MPIHSHGKRSFSSVFTSHGRQRKLTRRCAEMLLLTAQVAILSGCTLMPLKRFKPLVDAPAAPCTPDELSHLYPDEPVQIHYLLPKTAVDLHLASSPYLSQSDPAAGPLFDSYVGIIQQVVDHQLPPGLRDHKVTHAFTQFMATASGQAQLNAQIAYLRLEPKSKLVSDEQASIDKHRAPGKLKHGELKDFADKLFSLQLKLRVQELVKPPFGQAFVNYFNAYYKGKFYDRMGNGVSSPQVSLTITDSEITDAETMLLEFLIDSIDPTPILIDKDGKFYPGDPSQEPTALATSYVLPFRISSNADACGITTTNVWILRDLANGAADQAGAVGGLVANTWGGISIGVGILPKLSIGDNQTLSEIVKTAASRMSMRVTLAASYVALSHVHLRLPEPGT